MKRRNASKVMALILSFVMLVSVIPMTVFASVPNRNKDNTVQPLGFGTNDYYNVISRKDYTLVPGAATETEMVINNSAGNRRQVMHIIEVDPSNPAISIVPGYYGIDKDLTDVNNWKAAGVTETVKYYEETLGYNVVGAMNTSLAYDSNAPIDFLVYNGVNLSAGSHHAQTFLAVIKDPDTGEISCELHSYADGIPENCWQAVSANFGFTVKNGELVSKTEERTSAAAARSMLGIKEDGTLVIVMNDGRGANNSVGFNNYELGESMLALGCKWAVNCDGGGSSSFVTKRAGESVNTMRCVPCDGAERPTINSILMRAWLLRWICKNKTGKYLCYIWSNLSMKIPVAFFGAETVTLPFEDDSFPVPAQYDTYLRQQYGDYMVLPPPEKRNGGHGEYAIIDLEKDWTFYYNS